MRRHDIRAKRWPEKLTFHFSFNERRFMPRRLNSRDRKRIVRRTIAALRSMTARESNNIPMIGRSTG
jgi:hypothetical protein